MATLQLLPPLYVLRDPSTRSEAFRQLVEATSQQLYAVVRSIVQFHDDADDVLQNTYMKAWQGLASFRGDAQLSSWLYKIAVNESLTFLARRRDTVVLNDEILPERSLESDVYFDGDAAQLRLQHAISQLPDKQRAVFTLKYFHEMKYEEMSQMLDTSVGALKASYHLAVKKIEKYLASDI